MFSIPVKVVEISGGGEGLPMMTWDDEDAYYESFDPEYPPYLFSNTNKTIEALGEGYVIKAKGNHLVIPDRWYLEMTLDASNGQDCAYGVMSSASSLSSSVPFFGASQQFNGLLYIGDYEIDASINPAVFATHDDNHRLLSLDGISPIESFADTDVLQFAGDRSDGTLWIGLNGSWLYWATSVYNEGLEIYELEWSSLGDPENDVAPTLESLPSSLYVYCKSGNDGSGGATLETTTLLTHTDDLVYMPPTGFSVVSGEAEITYLHILRDRNLMPISQPTDHTIMGALGL